MYNETAAAHDGTKLSLRDWFDIAWNRRIPDLLDMPVGLQLNLGAGRRDIGSALALDIEHGWDADIMPIPRLDDSVAGIWAHGFFEHIQYPVRVLAECQRVLVVGGVMNICVPHALCQNAYGDLDHKHFYTEDTWRNLFSNEYYDTSAKTGVEWRLKVHACFFIGVEFKNIALLTQLVKV